jgi:hypothetical protein
MHVEAAGQVTESSWTRGFAAAPEGSGAWIVVHDDPDPVSRTP